MSNRCPAKGGYCVVDIGDHERRQDVQFCGQGPRSLDGGRGEVKAAGQSTVPCPRERVEADMALQVHQPLAAHVADLDQLERAQPLLTGPKTGEVVAPAGQVDRNPVVPVGPVEGRQSNAAVSCGSPASTRGSLASL